MLFRKIIVCFFILLLMVGCANDGIVPEVISSAVPPEIVVAEYTQTAPSATYELPKQINVPETVMPEVQNTTILDLTDFWDSRSYYLIPSNGAVEIKSSLFIEKSTIFNYGFREGAPEGISTLMWNSIEAINNFGVMDLLPGDKVVFTEAIKIDDKLLPGESQHGQGYYGTTNGMCNASSALSELFGARLVFADGREIPIFIARPGYVQPHDMDHNPKYYEYAYHGPGVAVNSTDLGSLPFFINPSLPEGILVRLGMSFVDSHSENPYDGVYKPMANVIISGIPAGYKVAFQRLSANRTMLLQMMTGTQEYYLKRAESAYFDPEGNLIINNLPIVLEPFKNKHPDPAPIEVASASNLRKIQLERFKDVYSVPDNMVNELIYPGGYAHRASKNELGDLIWETRDEWLPLNPEDLPSPIGTPSAEEYKRILNWNSVDDPANTRYKIIEKSGTTFCIVAIVDWAQAYNLSGVGSAPLPRWEGDLKFTTNNLYSWLNSYKAQELGWYKVTALEAQERANRGMFTLVIAQNRAGSGHVAAISPGIGQVFDNIFYPNTSQVGFENWGPDQNKTVLDTFRRITEYGDWSEPSYFTWIP